MGIIPGTHSLYIVIDAHTLLVSSIVVVVVFSYMVAKQIKVLKERRGIKRSTREVC